MLGVEITSSDVERDQRQSPGASGYRDGGDLRYFGS